MARSVKFWCMLLVASVLSGAAARASEDCSGPSEECVAIGHWSLSLAMGAGVRTNPLGGHDNLPIVLVPHVSYYGERVFLDDLDVGFTLAEGAANTLSLVASPGYDRAFFYRGDLQNIFIGGLPTATPGSTVISGSSGTAPATSTAVRRVATPEPSLTYLAGPEWTFRYRSVSGQLDALHDVSGHDHGDEIRGALGVPLWRAHGTLSLNAGFTWKSAAVVNYYYGIPALYHPGAAVNPFVKLGYARPLGGRWTLSALAEYERLGSAIAASPLVTERYVATVFVGAIRAF